MRAYASEMLVGNIYVREVDTAILCSQIWSSAVSVHIKAIIGAEEGTRTPTPLRVHGPEPCASANSATSAMRCARGLPGAGDGNYSFIVAGLATLSNVRSAFRDCAGTPPRMRFPPAKLTPCFQHDIILFSLSGGSNSVVECDLAKVEVAGSNPVSRSISFEGLLSSSLACCEGLF